MASLDELLVIGSFLASTLSLYIVWRRYVRSDVPRKPTVVNVEDVYRLASRFEKLIPANEEARDYEALLKEVKDLVEEAEAFAKEVEVARGEGDEGKEGRMR